MDETIENELGRSTRSLKGTIVTASGLWKLGDALNRVLRQRRDTPGNGKMERAMGIEHTRRRFQN